MIRAFRPRITFADLFGGMTERSGTVEVLEERFQAKFQIPHAVYFPSVGLATRAFFEGLTERRPEVVCSPYHSSTRVRALLSAGRAPLYVDTGRDFDADPVQFRAALASSTAGSGFVGCIYGTDIDDSFTGSFSKPILYDLSSCALVSRYPALKATDAILFDMGWDMPFTTIRGGMLCAWTRAQAIQWREWRECLNARESNGRSWSQAVQAYLGVAIREVEEYPGAWAYALGVRQLADRERLDSERRSQVARYHHAIKRLGGRVLLPSGDSLSHYPIRLRDRESLVAYLKERGVIARSGPSQLACDMPDLAGRHWREPENARSLLKDTLLLPLYFGLTEVEQKRVVTHLTRWLDALALPGQSVPCYSPAR